MNNIGEAGIGLWDEEDQFFYDVLHLPDGAMVPLKVRSMVGLIPLIRRRNAGAGTARASPRFQAPAGMVPEISAGSRRIGIELEPSRAAATADYSRCYAAIG